MSQRRNNCFQIRVKAGHIAIQIHRALLAERDLTIKQRAYIKMEFADVIITRRGKWWHPDMRRLGARLLAAHSWDVELVYQAGLCADSSEQTSALSVTRRVKVSHY
jgi:hypothetical protein